MDPSIARDIAYRLHAGQLDRHDDPVVEHVERVAAAVAEHDQAVAFLHDALEMSDVDPEELIALGLTPLELAALELLTRAPDETYEAHTLRVVRAAGPAARAARRVKLADLEDHLARATMPNDAPPYRWARKHVLAAQTGLGEAAPPGLAAAG